MARSITLNGTSYSLPQTGDSGWSLTGGVDDYLVALSSGVLTKAGGTFTLTAEVNTGATYGFKTAYLKTQTTAPAAAGVVQLAKTDTVSWRNNANGADLALGINASDLPTFNSIALVDISTAQTLTNKSMSGSTNTFTSLPASALTGTVSTTNGGTGQNFSASTGLVKVAAGVASAATLVNADVSGTAGIAYSKLALTGAILNADLAGSIAYSKLALTGAILNADVSGTAGIAYSKLSLAGSIATADLASGLLVPITKGGTGQITANLALNALLPSQATASGKVLSSNGTDTSWAAALTTTLSSAHIFVGNGSSVATDVAVTGDVTLDNTGATAIGTGKVTSAMILDGTIVNADINASAAIAGSKIVTAVPGTTGGVLPAGGTPGNITGVAVAAGYVGETTLSQVLRAAPGISLTTGAGGKTVLSFSVPSAGIWLIYGNVGFTGSGTATILRAEFSTGANTLDAPLSGTGGGRDDSCFMSTASNVLGTQDCVGALAPILVTTTAAKSWYIVAQGTFSGTCNVYGRCQVVRIV